MSQPILDDNSEDNMPPLPVDWWQRKSSASLLLQGFRSHIVPLLLAGEVENKIQYNVYTGVFLQHHQTMLWITAGHVVDEIQRFLSSPNFKLSTIAWLDEFQAENAEGIRLHRTDMPMKSWYAEGLDVGVIIPSLLDV